MRATLSIHGVLAVVVILCSQTGCRVSCLRGEDGCQVESPCQALSVSCAGDDRLEVRTLDQAQAVLARGGWDAMAARGDVLLGNGRVTAVIAGLGNQNFLDPSGGSLLDLAVRDKKNDGLNQIVPVVGVLPRDSANYTELRVIDERPRRVAVQVRGTLFQQPEVRIATLYEIRPCEPGVRVRTEVQNGTPDVHLWALADGYYWSGRESVPFTAGGTGFLHPSFNLLTINDAYRSAPLLAAATPSAPVASYATLSCDDDLLTGFNAAQVSAMGRPQTVVPPRDYLVFERFYAVADSDGVSGAIDVALGLRQSLRGVATATVSGTVERGGQPLGESRLASLLISEVRGGERVPWTQVVPDTAGHFLATLPAGADYVVEVHSFGQKVSEKAVTGLTGSRDLGTLSARASARMSVHVTDAMAMRGIDAEVFVVPAGDPTATTGSFHGVYERCAPFLGPTHGSSPACNRFLVAADRGAEVEVPPGRYHFYAYHGPFYTLDRKTVDIGPGPQTLDLAVRPLPLLPAGALTADLHVHGAASFDSSIPDTDRVRAFSAADLPVIIATDHDVVYDYSAIIDSMGLGDRMTCVPGVETTGHIPFLKIPGSDFPLVIGHYNFWPISYQPGLPRNGGPFDEFVEPGELFDRVDPLYQKGRVSIAQLNHPFADPEFGRDLGFPRALGFSLLADLPAEDDGSAAGMYVRAPHGGHRNNDHQTQEVMNGTQNDIFLPYRAFWFYSLNQGQLHTGTANSDSHGLTDNNVGTPRNVVFAGTSPGRAFDVDKFNQALRDGKSLGTNGPIIGATVDTESGEEGFGMRLLRPTASGKLKLQVSAAPWVPVDEVRIYVNGKLARKIDGAAIAHPADAFGSAGTMRYQGEVPLGELLPAAGDAWLVVEAGTALPLYADLGGGTDNAPDGVPDTTDNNGDGRVDQADVEEGKSVGPLRNPAPPADERDPRYHFAKVQLDGYPLAFTNPFLFDRNGNGKFDAPRTAGAR